VNWHDCSIICSFPTLTDHIFNWLYFRRIKWWSNWWAASAPRSGLRLRSSCLGALASSAESAGTTTSTRPSTKILGRRKRTGTCGHVSFSRYFNARFCRQRPGGPVQKIRAHSVYYFRLFSTTIPYHFRCLYTEQFCWSTAHRATAGRRSPRSCTAAPIMRSRTTGTARWSGKSRATWRWRFVFVVFDVSLVFDVHCTSTCLCPTGVVCFWYVDQHLLFNHSGSPSILLYILLFVDSSLNMVKTEPKKMRKTATTTIVSFNFFAWSLSLPHSIYSTSNHLMLTLTSYVSCSLL